MFFWIFAMAPPLAILGRLGKLTFRKAPTAKASTDGKVPGGKAPGSGDRINTTLLAWTLAVAASVPLAMPGTFRTAILSTVTNTTTTVALSVGTTVANFFGWS